MKMTLEEADAIQQVQEKVSNEIDWIFENKPPFPFNGHRAMRILVEEAFEVIKEVGPQGDNANLKHELIQLAAVATIWASKLE